MSNLLVKKWRGLFSIVIFNLLLTSCNMPGLPGNEVPTRDPQAQINQAVVATLASIPTYTPYPIPTPYPSPTLASISGLFCEYGFCIGHPVEMAFMDEGSTRKPPVIGSQSNGIVFGYTETMFIQLNWRISDPNFNPQSAMSIILEETQTLQGNLDALLVGDMNVYYQPSSTVTAALPYGAVATWQCGGRDFIWKVYTPQDGMAQGILKDSLARFRCQ